MTARSATDGTARPAGTFTPAFAKAPADTPAFARAARHPRVESDTRPATTTRSTRPPPTRARVASRPSARSARLIRHFVENSRRRRAPSRPHAGWPDCELLERGLRGKLPAAQCEAKTVAGHRIDEACRVTGKQQARASSRARVRRPTVPSPSPATPAWRRRTDHAEPRRPRAHARTIACCSARGVGSEPCPSVTTRDIRHATGQRRDADVAAAADVHLAALASCARRARSRRRTPSGAGARA